MLGKDGKPIKTKSGDSVKLKELVVEAVERASKVDAARGAELSPEKRASVNRAVGIGAVKYADLRQDRTTDYVFDFDRMLALDGNTGTYKWHYQINPGESWDYTATNDMEFASLAIGGETRKVLMTAPKNGFFYVIDRINGRLISAEPFVKVNWATKIDLKTGRPVENPAARYPKGTTFTMELPAG